MGDRPWHKRYHGNAIAGYMGLTLEERGAYSTLLDYLYDRRMPLQPNMRLIAGYLDVSVRKAESIITALMQKGKIYRREDGTLSNHRFEKELENDAKTSDLKRVIGSAGGRRSAEKTRKPRKINAAEPAKPKQQPSLLEPEPEGEGRKKPVTSTPTPSAPDKATKAALPDGFPTAQAKAAAAVYWQGKDRPDLCATVEDQAEQFRDHHLSRGNKMLDWPAAWRTWVRNAIEMTRPPRTRTGGMPMSPPPNEKDTSIELWVWRLVAFHHGQPDDGISGEIKRGYWQDRWGPNPNQPGCLAPAAAIQEYRRLHPMTAVK